MAYTRDDSRAVLRSSALSFFPPQEGNNGKPTPSDAHQLEKKLIDLQEKVNRINAMRQQSPSGQVSQEQKDDYVNGLKCLEECRQKIIDVVSPRATNDVNDILDDYFPSTDNSFKF